MKVVYGCYDPEIILYSKILVLRVYSLKLHSYLCDSKVLYKSLHADGTVGCHTLVLKLKGKPLQIIFDVKGD